jgi:hypothetical protein
VSSGNTSTFHRARLCSSSRQSLSFWQPLTARAIAASSFYVHNDQHSQIKGQVHSQRQTLADQIQHTKNGRLPIFLHTFQEEGSSCNPCHSGSVLPCLLIAPLCQLGNLTVLRNPCWYFSILILLSWGLSFSVTNTRSAHTVVHKRRRRLISINGGDVLCFHRSILASPVEHTFCGTNGCGS